MEVAILGPLVVTEGTSPITFTAGKERAVLTALALRPGRIVPPDKLIDLVWGDRPPVSAHVTVRGLVSRMRRRLGAAVMVSMAGTAGYMLELPVAAVDAERFAAGVAAGRRGRSRGDWEQAERQLAAALGEWRGEALIDLSPSPAAAGERARLEELRLDAIEERFDAALALGRHRELVAELEAQLAEQPLRERLWAQLMVALYRSDRQSDALRSYQRARTRLVDELGVEPGAVLRDLEAAVLAADERGRTLLACWPAPPTPEAFGDRQGQPAPIVAAVRPSPAANQAARVTATGHGAHILLSRAIADLDDNFNLDDMGLEGLTDLASAARLFQVGGKPFPPLGNFDRRPHKLPVQRTELIGRQAELQEVVALLGRHRLVSLLGIGGTGKTRLALSIAAECVDVFPDGVWFVDLVPVGDEARLVEACATVMGLALTGRGDPLDQWCTVLDERRTLLVLDNCEHVTDEVAELVDHLLAVTHQPRLLITSREPVGLPDERQVQVPPLAVADDLDAPAVALFAAAAERVGHVVTAAELPLVVRACRNLDGLPLALELAAAQLRPLRLGELVDRLDQRFELLQRGRQGRQSSLLGVLQDTWGMLDEDERRLLLELAAFPASFDLAGVEGVSRLIGLAVPGRTFAGLVDRGLVVDDGERHRLLETVRLFARRRWPDDASPAAVHAGWCLAHVRSFPAEAPYTSEELLRWAIRHQDDVFAAEAHLAEAGAHDDVVDLITACDFYLQWGGQRAHCVATVARIHQYLACWDLERAAQGRLWLSIAMAGLAARRADWIADGAATAVALLDGTGREVDLAAAEMVHSWMVALRDPDTALRRIDTSIERARAAGAPALANAARSYRVSHLLLAGRADEGRAEIDALLADLAGSPVDYAWRQLHTQIAAAYVVTDPAMGVAAMAALRSHFRQTGIDEAMVSMIHAAAAAANSDVVATLELIAEAQAVLHRAGTDNGLPDLLLAPAILAWRRGDLARARRWLCAIRNAGRPTQNFPITAMFRQVRDRAGIDEAAPTQPVEATFDEALAWLRALEPDLGAAVGSH